MIRQWLTASAYQHCFLIPLVSVWLGWRLRFILAGIQPSPSLLAPAGIIAAGCIWLTGSLSDIELIQQFAGVALIPLGVWAVAGSRLVRAIAFPCAYLLFMIPFGDSLLPDLMNLTAGFITATVTAFGVPIYRDGLVLTTASGTFEVIEGCAGLKYMLASGPVAVLFSYLVYRFWWKRILFVLAALGISILANGTRASTVVLVAHFTNMRLGAGYDHILFGQILFGVVTLLTLLAGLPFADERPAQVAIRPPGDGHPDGTPIWRFPAATGLFLALVAIAPISASVIKSRTLRADPPAVLQRLPIAESPWTGPYEPSADSTPVFRGAISALSGQYRYAAHRVDVHVISYRNQKQGGELINSGNTAYDPKVWTDIGQTTGTVITHDLDHDYIETELRSANGRRRLVRTWYTVNGERAHRPLVVKFLELRNTVMGRAAVSSAVLIGTYADVDSAHAREVLDQFMATDLPHKMESPVPAASLSD
jgi:exosortase A